MAIDLRVGVLSCSTVGLELLHKHGIFKNLYGISQLPARDDLNRLLISGLDYNMYVILQY